MAIEYPNTNLYIDGKWRPAVTGDTLDVINPATEEVIGQVARAQHADLDEALEAADKAFAS
jgi:succinate-semialdehyde dehydrogenase/glutarate-semialdehyde dehydrogenase